MCEVGASKPGGSKAPGLLGTELTAKEKAAERMKKLRDLHLKRNEARLIYVFVKVVK